jgi:glycosyltransferase involved in cell wall biosynthesis
MRFHVLGICHTVTSKEYLSCAFTQKVVKFCEMMTPQTAALKEEKNGLSTNDLIRHKTLHHIIHYGHEDSEVVCDEHVTVMTNEVLKKTYGDYDWKKEFFKHSSNDLTHSTFTINSIFEINKRKQRGDFILCFWGRGHKEVADKFAGECIVVEPGIGYPLESSFANFKVFESYAAMHYNYGMAKTMHPAWYDCVIPNYFDPSDFRFEKEKGNYFLYLGRIITSKGLQIVIDLAKKMGFRLLIAGQGSIEKDLGIKNIPANIEYVGFADLEKRKALMAGAKALFLPTYYVEPFGGVTMEAMMSGTPVITTDWGVFAETVLHGLTGYRCRTVDQFEWAVNNIDKIDPQACRDWALNNYSTQKIRIMYEEYFDMLLRVKFSKGFYDENPTRTDLDWLVKEYPVPSKEFQTLPVEFMAEEPVLEESMPSNSTDKISVGPIQTESTQTKSVSFAPVSAPTVSKSKQKKNARLQS